MKRKIFGIIALISLFFVIGSTGALDLDKISVLQYIIQSAIGLIIFKYSLKFGKFASYKNMK